jgi:hypothetical protein
VLSFFILGGFHNHAKYVEYCHTDCYNLPNLLSFIILGVTIRPNMLIFIMLGVTVGQICRVSLYWFHIHTNYAECCHAECHNWPNMLSFVILGIIILQNMLSFGMLSVGIGQICCVFSYWVS